VFCLDVVRKQFQRSCYRASCKICYLKWIARQANNGTRRIEAYSEQHPNKKPIHLFFSPPPSQFDVPVKVLRKRLSHILKLGKIEGGALIFHPLRFNNKTRQWYWAPHFHFIGFGSERYIRNAFGRYGWYIGNEGVRESTFQTFCYVLSHCGIQKGYKSVTWFGKLSYSNLPVEKEESLTHCPMCGRRFIEIYYDGIHPVVPPDRQYEGPLDSDGRWYPVKTLEESGNSFEYAPTRDLNDVLKGIALTN